MTESKIVGGGDALTCDGCRGWATRDEAVAHFAIATDGSGRHACPQCVASDRLYLPLIGKAPFTWADLDRLMAGRPKVDRVANGQWMVGAERRGQIVLIDADGAGRRIYRTASPLPFDPERLTLTIDA